MNFKRLIIIFSAIFLLGVVFFALSSAVAPYPENFENKEQLLAKISYFKKLNDSLGIDKPSFHPPSAVFPKGTGALGSFKILIILVKFPDKNSQVQSSFFDTLGFQDSFGSIKHYYREISYQTLDLVTVNLPSTTGWYQAPQNYSYYVDGQYGLYGTYPHNSQKLIEDLVDMANPDIDFSQYDNDSDGFVDGLVVVHSGTGAELSGSTNDMWSHKWAVSPRLKDGVYIYDYSIQPEYWYTPGDMTLGVFCHEIGHIFGLPDLYDTDYSSKGVGRWSLMGSGSWNGSLGNSPAHPDIWCKSVLGYVNPTNITSNTTGATVPQVETNTTGYRLWTNGALGGQYFLVENRQKTGYDASLPNSGLLIWHIDQSVSNNEKEWYPGYTSNGHYKVALEQADGLWELEKNLSSGNSGDPFPGSTVKRDFNSSTTPNSKDYTDLDTYVGINNISNSGSTMTCDFQVSPADVEGFFGSEVKYFSLEQNFPNPFNPRTQIAYTLAKSDKVKIEIFNLLGEKVKTLVEERQNSGFHLVSWDGKNERGKELASGIYLYRLIAGKYQETKKMMLLR
jgi:immune inhibitor A